MQVNSSTARELHSCYAGMQHAQTKNREIGSLCVLAGIYEDVRRLVLDLKLVLRICGHERAVVWQVRLVPVKR